MKASFSALLFLAVGAQANTPPVKVWTYDALNAAVLNGDHKILVESDITFAAPIEIPAGKNIRIYAKGERKTLDGNGETQLFRVDGTLTLQHLVLAEGYATNGFCSYTQNSGEECGGGAVHVDVDAHLIVDGCAFRDSQARYGGAIYTYGGAVDVSGSTFTENGAYEAGGAVWTYAHVALSISNCEFTGNVAIKAGAVFTGGDTTIADSTFSGNVATASEPSDDDHAGGFWGGEGGAIWVNEDTVRVDRCAFEGNRARTEGAAIYVRNLGEAVVAATTFSGNLADCDGVVTTGRYSCVEGLDDVHPASDRAVVDCRDDCPGGSVGACAARPSATASARAAPASSRRRVDGPGPRGREPGPSMRTRTRALEADVGGRLGLVVDGVNAIDWVVASPLAVHDYGYTDDTKVTFGVAGDADALRALLEALNAGGIPGWAVDLGPLGAAPVDVAASREAAETETFDRTEPGDTAVASSAIVVDGLDAADVDADGDVLEGLAAAVALAIGAAPNQVANVAAKWYPAYEGTDLYTNLASTVHFDVAVRAWLCGNQIFNPTSISLVDFHTGAWPTKHWSSDSFTDAAGLEAALEAALDGGGLAAAVANERALRTAVPDEAAARTAIAAQTSAGPHGRVTRATSSAVVLSGVSAAAFADDGDAAGAFAEALADALAVDAGAVGAVEATAPGAYGSQRAQVAFELDDRRDARLVLDDLYRVALVDTTLNDYLRESDVAALRGAAIDWGETTRSLETLTFTHAKDDGTPAAATHAIVLDGVAPDVLAADADALRAFATSCAAVLGASHLQVSGVTSTAYHYVAGDELWVESCPTLEALPEDSALCPDDLDLDACDAPGRAIGDLCEGDGECGTDKHLDNCGNADDRNADIYRVVADIYRGPAHAGVVPRGALVAFDVALRAWPARSTPLRTAGATKAALWRPRRALHGRLPQVRARHGAAPAINFRRVAADGEAVCCAAPDDDHHGAHHDPDDHESVHDAAAHHGAHPAPASSKKSSSSSDSSAVVAAAVAAIGLVIVLGAFAGYRVRRRSSPRETAHAGDVELEDVEPDRAAALGTFPKEHPSRVSDSRLFPIKQAHRETKSPLYPNAEMI
ncbi:hypothetical protein JL721_2597 [Aureococcus anophagefferens]|nr:hypothetical protein JL721_2597 [Aureococcus anophagefferens]